MTEPTSTSARWYGRADASEDNYDERVTRNEGRLVGLEDLVRENRESDRRLIEQRSDSLARELERRADALIELVTTRADAVLDLGREERESDRREVELLTAEAEKRAEITLNLLREVYDTAIRQNYEQSREAMNALEQRGIARTEKVEQMVTQWRESDAEGRAVFTKQLDRHLDTLNHSHERMREFQATSVTRELWQAEKDASINREGLLRDQIITIEKALLSMNTTVAADKSHHEIRQTMDANITAASKVLENKIGVLGEKLADLKSYRDTTTGRSAGYQSFYGWGIAAVTVLISAIVLVNAFLTR